MVPHPFRRCIFFLLLVCALARTARGQSQVYVLDEGTVPLSCSGHPCHGPTLHLIDSTTGHDIAIIQAAPTGQRGTSVRAFDQTTHPRQLLVVDPTA